MKREREFATTSLVFFSPFLLGFHLLRLRLRVRTLHRMSIRFARLAPSSSRPPLLLLPSSSCGEMCVVRVWCVSRERSMIMRRQMYKSLGKKLELH